jgi:hypothetical protein
MKEMQETLLKIDSKFDEMDKKIDKKIDKKFDEMDEKIEKKIDNVASDLNKVASDLKDLSNNFNKYQPVFEKAGLTYELSVRRAVSDKRGLSYARSFTVKNLEGLARISAPKDKDNQLMLVPDWDTGKVLRQRTHQLAEHAIHFIPRVRAIAEGNDTTRISKNKKFEALSQLALFDALGSDDNDARLRFLEDNPLGLMAFSCKAYNDSKSFDAILECDVRGESKARRRGIIEISVGEVKSGKDRGVAIEQLLKRLCIMGQAARFIFGEDSSSQPNQKLIILDLQGEIFSPLEWEQVLPEEIPDILAKLNLFEPAHGYIEFSINRVN